VEVLLPPGEMEAGVVPGSAVELVGRGVGVGAVGVVLPNAGVEDATKIVDEEDGIFSPCTGATGCPPAM